MVLFLPSALLLAPSNHLSALLLSPESALLTLGLLLDGEPLEASVCVLLLFFESGEGPLWCLRETER